MIKIGIVGDIGSGKSFVANNFGYPVFNADHEVEQIYKKNKKIFLNLRSELPKHITKFPIHKKEIINAILNDQNNLRKIIKIVHKEVRRKLNFFLKKNKNKKIVILDIPLLIENKLYNKKDLLIFVDSKKKDINERLKKRPKFNSKLLKIFRKIQLNPNYKRKKSHFIIKNTYTKKPVKNEIAKIINKIL